MNLKEAELVRAKQWVKRISDHIDALIAQQHPINADAIDRDPDYRNLRVQLLQAQNTVRELERRSK
jgi:hypothetical protein